VQSAESADLYEHCVRAIRHGLNFGAHGLPLMGSGDWTDGMNKVGLQGRGESVWLGFFLYHVLTRFADLAELHADIAFARVCREESASLRVNLDKHGWDGAWYRRAYFDDGSPLGSAGNAECRIDSIAQSWSVLSHAGDPARARKAMDALDERLVDRSHALIKLLDPPFDTSAADPGYIKGYLPGVRENGGQYTHAAIWAAMAFAQLGDANRAGELLAMIAPANHALTPQAADLFKVEPYVVSADVYSVVPHRGRGGWSWYTGSAAWLYRLITESLLGLHLEAGALRIAPRLPDHWPGFTATYRHHETTYEITVTHDATTTAALTILLDGEDQNGHAIPLVNDTQTHHITVTLGPTPIDPELAAVSVDQA
jgi:cellobiose phosphorylase